MTLAIIMVNNIFPLQTNYYAKLPYSQVSQCIMCCAKCDDVNKLSLKKITYVEE